MNQNGQIEWKDYSTNPSTDKAIVTGNKIMKFSLKEYTEEKLST